MTTAASSATQDQSPWIEIFRAGDYRDKGKGLVTREDLTRVVASYDPSFHEAPVTVGHPADNLPAFGWIGSLELQGDVLVAREKQVDPQFNELRQAGRYKKRSASFYTGTDGKISGLRHVAYLGAQPPEVKGLRDVKFEDNGRGFIEMDFAEEDQVAEKTVAEQITDFFREHFGGTPTPKNFSEDDAKRIATEAVTAAVAPFQAKVTELETKLAKQATEFSERESRLTLAELGQRTAAAVTKLKSAGKWIPAFDRAGVPLIFAELAKLTTTVEFGEGDQKKATAPFDLFENFLESLPKIVPGGTIFNPQAADRAATVDYGEKADPNSVQLHQLATKLASDKSISYGEALMQVAKDHLDLTKPGNGTAGAV